MKRIFLFLLLLFLALLSHSPSQGGSLSSFATEVFREAAKSPTVRAVFDLESDEAVAVFGDEKIGLFL